MMKTSVMGLVVWTWRPDQPIIWIKRLNDFVYILNEWRCLFEQNNGTNDKHVKGSYRKTDIATES